MKQFKLGFVVTLLFSVAAIAAPVDYFELGLGGHYMLDQNTFSSPNEEFVNMATFNNAIFKLQGDFGSGLSGHAALGHHYSGPGSIILKFDYYYTPIVEGELTNYELAYHSDLTTPFWVFETMNGERRFSFHTVTLGWRHEFSPEEDLHSFIDFGIGFTTASYSLTATIDYSKADSLFFDAHNVSVADQWDFKTGAFQNDQFEKRKTQTGFAAIVSYGLLFDLSETLNLYGRVDLNLAKITNTHNQYNETTGIGPWTNALALNFGIRKWFSTPYPALRGGGR